MVGVALASPATVAADRFRMALKKKQVVGIWSFDGQHGLHTLREILHRSAGRRCPLTVDIKAIATDPFQLPLQIADQAQWFAVSIGSRRPFRLLPDWAGRDRGSRGSATTVSDLGERGAIVVQQKV
jgi:hypothetical protein